MANADPVSLYGSSLVIDIHSNSFGSKPGAGDLCNDIACDYVNVQLVKGECRGKET